MSEENYSEIEKIAKQIIKRKEKFLRYQVTKEQALDLFQDNPFKLELINKKVKDKTSIYKTGNFIDLCTGPHLEHTG